MLKIVIPENEYYDEQSGEFVRVKEWTLELEHSLRSLAKWESKWHKPFLSKDEKTEEETLDYIRCMTIRGDVPDWVYNFMSRENLQAINDYINDPMTATWFSKQSNKQFNREVITAEIIYYWMVSLQIPFNCENWHLSRLITLIRVCNEKNAEKEGSNKKMSKRALMSRNTSLNAARRQKMKSSG